MISAHRTQQRHIKLTSRHTGFSLSELMIAMVLGLIIMIAVINFFAPLKTTVEESKRLENAADALRYTTLTLSKSIKQADNVALVSANELVLSTRASASQPSISCLGQSKTADYTETFSFLAPNLSCDDGDGAQTLLTGLEAAHFSQTGELVSINLKPLALPTQYDQGISLQIALRKPLWQQAINSQQVP
ncbi:prepilin-type N-terminal cleavage/methylation domain-containing protein [Shewanella putrefaciens]|nr:prepilin-type N-terminal cleavage/methylation domain-containing protein [Shewanella putrefaciens]